MVNVLSGYNAGDQWSSVPPEPLEDNIPCRVEGYADLNALHWHDKSIRASLRRKTVSPVVLAVSYAGSDGVPRIARIVLQGNTHFYAIVH